ERAGEQIFALTTVENRFTWLTSTCWALTCFHMETGNTTHRIACTNLSSKQNTTRLTAKGIANNAGPILRLQVTTPPALKYE
ncbi:MAG: hypothetical protein J0651_04260, partial [Actinobacteria bacterium]|nr:hypothetical protein [Actinomycetota bacterium]